MTVRRATVVGPGRIGLSLAVALDGVPGVERVQVVGRRDVAPDFLVDLGTGAPSYARSSEWSPPGGGGTLGLFLAVPDDALASAVEEWAERLAGRGGEGGGSPAPLAFHTSGSRPAEILEPFRARAGCRVGVLHPLRAVSRPDAHVLTGAAFGVAGDEDAVAAARAIAAGLGGRALTVRPGRHARYHAAAVFASNFLVACLEVAGRQMNEAVEEEMDPGALLPLARSALEAMAAADEADGTATGGGARGLTGPVARGDTGTLERHLAALDPEAGRLYALLTRILARDVAGMGGEQLEAVTAALRGGEPEEPGDSAGGTDEREGRE